MSFNRYSEEWLLDRYRRMFLIREFEESLPRLYREGIISGTGHLCLGQEAGTVAISAALEETDVVFSNHRGHGHFLALTGDAPGLLRELMGRSDGPCGGKGGSQHLCLPRRFFSNGILGGMIPCATGYALAQQAAGTGAIVVAFLGDGALGEGVVYESFNLASLWRLPILFVIEDNGYSQSTPKARNLAGQISSRLEAFGIQTQTVASTDFLRLWSSVERSVGQVRSGAGPCCLIFEAPRLCGHSVNSGEFAGESELVRLRKQDPLPLMRSKLPEESASQVEAEVHSVLQELFNAPWVRAVHQS